MEKVINNNQVVKKERNSAFELLRIISIVIIIMHHFAIHGGFDFSSLDNSNLVIVNRIWIELFQNLGKFGVNIFFLISAFFLSGTNKFKIRKVINIFSQMLFFSIVLGVIYYFVYDKEPTSEVIKSIILPFGYETWWFMTYYLLIYFFSPFLNYGIKSMNKKMHLIMIIVLIIIWSVLPTFVDVHYAFSNFGWFITIYFIGSYIKLYDVSLKIRPFLGILLSISIFLLWFAIKFSIETMSNVENKTVSEILKCFELGEKNNFIQTVSAVVMFLSFKNIKMRNIKAINIIASTTLIVYLLHDHENSRTLLWIDIFKNASFAASPYLIIYSIGVTLLVFVICGVIALIYNYSIGLGINKMLDKLDRKYLYKVDNIFNNKNDESGN